MIKKTDSTLKSLNFIALHLSSLLVVAIFIGVFLWFMFMNQKYYVFGLLSSLLLMVLDCLDSSYFADRESIPEVLFSVPLSKDVPNHKEQNCEMSVGTVAKMDPSG